MVHARRSIPIARCLTLLVIVTTCLLSVGCFIPEQFDASIDFAKDGTYTVVYDGVLTYALALAAAKEGHLTPADDEELRREAGKLLPASEGFQQVDYIGKGRFKVRFKKALNAGQPFYFLSSELNIFSILPQQNGTTRIETLTLQRKDIAQFGEIGAKIDGTFSVSLPSSFEVLRHNAESEPMFFGLLGSYKWHINSPGTSPLIILRAKR